MGAGAVGVVIVAAGSVVVTEAEAAPAGVDNEDEMPILRLRNDIVYSSLAQEWWRGLFEISIIILGTSHDRGVFKKNICAVQLLSCLQPFHYQTHSLFNNAQKGLLTEQSNLETSG